MSSKKQEKKTEEPQYTPPARSVTTRRDPTPRPAAVSGPGSFIGKSLDIKADITSDEDITIEGRVNGNISVSRTLTIGRSGNVTADIKAAVVRIIGTAKGNIIASDKVEILSQGRYTGNIESKKLVVAEGAVLNGFINKDQEGKS
ncbi:MAG: polymer-forming cytoskeletal protein [bacterium]|nr:polymer-forming cytoskeletal protein [bacterium]